MPSPGGSRSSAWRLPGWTNLGSKRRAGDETPAEPRDAGANLALVVLEPDFCVLDRAGTRAVLSETDELDGGRSLWVSSALARWPKTHAARGCRIGLVQRSALLPGRCSLQPLVVGCAVSDWYVPLTVSGTGAVRSRSDGSGPLGARFAAAFWSF